MESSLPGKYDGFIKYDKLVRDRIPEIIASSGVEYEIHVASDEEYRGKLRDKFDEEVREFQKNPCVEEFADVQEIMNEMARFMFGGVAVVGRVRRKKLGEQGGFEKQIILDWTDNR